jgi:hypothetical protein
MRRSPRPLSVFATLLATLFAGALASVGDANGALLKRLDYETGTLKQWTYIQAMPGRITIVNSPRRQGRFAARFVVRHGDRPVSGTGERTEVLGVTHEHRGTNSWWAWSTYFPSSFNPVHGTWNDFMQWHQTHDRCPPPLVFYVNTERSPARLMMKSRGGRLNGTTCKASSSRRFTIARFNESHWYDFKLHIRWSPYRAYGHLHLWVNGRSVVRAARPTLYRGQGVYVKQGFYRAPSSRTSVVFHDGLRRFRP